MRRADENYRDQIKFNTNIIIQLFIHSLGSFFDQLIEDIIHNQ